MSTSRAIVTFPARARERDGDAAVPGFVYDLRVRTCSLQSGSNGNSIYVEADGVRLLFDAGISGLVAQRRLEVHGLDIRKVDALIISHDHDDHIRGAGVFQRKFKVPIHVTGATLEVARGRLGRLGDVRTFRSGESLSFGEVTVHTVRTAHDAVDGLAFVVEHSGRRLAILTDLGHPSPWLQEVLEAVDAAYLECNYDAELLETGGYPPHLKARIRGDGGHLSNDESAKLLAACGRRRPEWVAVAHLSRENNRPELAVQTMKNATGPSYPVRHAPRYACSELFCV